MKTLQKLNANFNAPTPTKFRKLGKAISLFGTTIQVTIAGMQLGSDASIMTPKQYFFFVVGLAVAQWLGQTITDFFTEEPTPPKPDEQA